MVRNANVRTFAIYYIVLSHGKALSLRKAKQYFMDLIAEKRLPSILNCTSMLMPVRDALEVLSGSWKLPIIISLSFGDKRFKEISRDIPGITDKMLSKELKELEAHKLLTRTVHDSFPPRVEYAITPHGRSLEKMVHEIYRWGVLHRKEVMGK